MADFDPYYKWLGIPPKDQPPNHYRLLAIELFESDADVIESAADQRMAHARTFQTGQNSAISQRILNELSAAKLCLLNPQKKAEYDRQLREKLNSAPTGQAPMPTTGRVAMPLPLPVPPAGPFSENEPPAFIVPPSATKAPSVLAKRPSKPTLWQQPAVLAAVGISLCVAIVILALVIRSPGGGSKPAAPSVAAESPGAKPTATVSDKNKLTNSSNSLGKNTAQPSPVAAPSVKPVDLAADASRAELTISEAVWSAGDKSLDVTDGVRRLVENNRLMMIVWSDLFGAPENALQGAKTLRLAYRLRGKPYKAEYFDSYFVYLDGRALAPPTAADGFELLEARFGAGNTFVDVLPQLQPHVRDGRLCVATDQFAAATAAELASSGIHSGAFKVLWVRYRNATGDHFNYAWNSQLLTIESRLPQPAGPNVDLLKLIDVKRDVVYGKWAAQGDHLLAPAEVAARIQIPFEVPSDYALTVVVESDGEIRDVSAGLVVGGRQVLATVDGAVATAGLSLVDGAWQMEDKNPTKSWRRVYMLEQGRPNTLTYVVRPTSVRVLRDGAEIIRWSGDPRTFSLPKSWEVPDPRRLYLQSYSRPLRITKVELTPLAPETSPVRIASDSSDPIDAIGSITLDRDRLHGDWQYDGSSLVSPGAGAGILQLPVIVPADYQLEAVAQRVTGGDSLAFTLPIVGAQATVVLDGYQGTLPGLQTIDGKNIDANESKREASIFGDGKPHAIRIIVQKNSVRALCDEKPLVEWSGDVNRLGRSGEAPYKDRIYLETWNSGYRLTDIRVTPLRGE